jgi:DNA-binding CsgD family transcriptional regulator
MEALPGVAFVLEQLAGVSAELESYQVAARLLGAAQALRDAIGLRMYPLGPAPYDRDLALVRAGLGSEAFEAARAEGATMSWQEAVAYATRGRGERKRPSSGWASLTPTELQVVKLVAQGLTNRDIAARLFVERSTVMTHLNHVFRKLGFSKRAEVAAEAVRRGL